MVSARWTLLLLVVVVSAHAVDFTRLPDGSWTLANKRVRARWQPVDGEWSCSYELRTGTGWAALAGSSYGVDALAPSIYESRFRSFSDRFKPGAAFPANDDPYGHPGDAPPTGTVRMAGNPTTPPRLIASAADSATVRSDGLLESNGTVFNLTVTVHLDNQSDNLTETVHFTRLRPVGRLLTRFRKAFSTPSALPAAQRYSILKSFSHFGWSYAPDATFLVASTAPSAVAEWSLSRGSSHMSELEHLSEPCKIFVNGSTHTVWHSAPPGTEGLGWFDTAATAYSLEHAVLLSSAYVFSNQLIEQLRSIVPYDPLPPRYPMRHFADKAMWALRYTQDGFQNYTAADGSPFGYYAKDWYSLAGQGPAPRQEVEHSPDWGSSFDAWTAVFLLHYQRLYGDADGFISSRLQLIISGFELQPWQVEDRSSGLAGAIWQTWISGRGFGPAGFVRGLKSKALWVCDTGKTGYMWLKIAALTGDNPVLLQKARRAGEYLVAIQQTDGHLPYSVVMYNNETHQSTPVAPSNFGGSCAAILLLAKLGAITANRSFVTAASRLADAVISKWLQPGQFEMMGGELDDVLTHNGFLGTTAAMYGTMGFAELTLATGEPRFKNATRAVADSMRAGQWSRRINYGYFRQKARWMGADFQTSGSFQGWVRPEDTYFMWMAWRATRESAYLESMRQHANWMTYIVIVRSRPDGN